METRNNQAEPIVITDENMLNVIFGEPIEMDDEMFRQMYGMYGLDSGEMVTIVSTQSYSPNKYKPHERLTTNWFKEGF